MGKQKKKRAQQRKDKQLGDKQRAPTWANDLSGFLSGLRSTDKKVREHSCVAVASLFGKSEDPSETQRQLKHCIKSGAIKMLLNCLSDPVVPVTLEAAGALR